MATGTGKKSKGVIRFKTGFPPKIRDYIRDNLGDNWHLELRILDGDDGDGDDGDPGASPFAVAGATAAKGAKSARSSKGAKRASGRRKPRPRR